MAKLISLTFLLNILLSLFSTFSSLSFQHSPLSLFKAAKAGIGYQILQDCLRQISDSVDQLGLSIRELRRLNRKFNSVDDVLWHVSDVETWVSTALTDARTCVNSFPGERMSKTKSTIKVKALNVAQVTRNALALFHKYAARYRAAARATHKP